MEIELCRICLADGVRMYPLEHTRYHEIFEWHTEEMMDINDECLLSVCYLCNAVLNRLYNFLKQMINTEIFLKALRYTSHQIKCERVETFKREINSKPHNLSNTCLPNTNFIVLDANKEHTPPREFRKNFDAPPIVTQLQDIPKAREPEDIKEAENEKIKEPPPKISNVLIDNNKLIPASRASNKTGSKFKKATINSHLRKTRTYKKYLHKKHLVNKKRNPVPEKEIEKIAVTQLAPYDENTLEKSELPEANSPKNSPLNSKEDSDKLRTELTLKLPENCIKVRDSGDIPVKTKHHDRLSEGPIVQNQGDQHSDEFQTKDIADQKLTDDNDVIVIMEDEEKKNDKMWIDQENNAINRLSEEPIDQNQGDQHSDEVPTKDIADQKLTDDKDVIVIMEDEENKNNKMWIDQDKNTINSQADLALVLGETVGLGSCIKKEVDLKELKCKESVDVTIKIESVDEHFNGFQEIEEENELPNKEPSNNKETEEMKDSEERSLYSETVEETTLGISNKRIEKEKPIPASIGNKPIGNKLVLELSKTTVENELVKNITSEHDIDTAKAKAYDVIENKRKRKSENNTSQESALTTPAQERDSKMKRWVAILRKHLPSGDKDLSAKDVIQDIAVTKPALIDEALALVTAELKEGNLSKNSPLKSKDSNRSLTGIPQLKIPQDKTLVWHVVDYKHTDKVTDGPENLNQGDHYKDQVALKEPGNDDQIRREQDNCQNNQVGPPSNENPTQSDRDHPSINKNGNEPTLGRDEQTGNKLLNENKESWPSTVNLQRLPTDIIEKYKKNIEDNENTYYWCAHCYYKSESKHDVVSHLNVRHSKNQCTPDQCRAEKPIPKRTRKTTIRQCEICNREFKYEASYWRHFDKHALGAR